MTNRRGKRKAAQPGAAGVDFGPEQSVHGSAWGQQHGGYFSDPEVARAMVDAVGGIWRKANPDAVVDLGGGTGYFLGQLRGAGLGRSAAFVVLDASAEQLRQAEAAGLACVQGSVNAFRRGEVAPAGGRVLYVMRSVLHYAGRRGWRRIPEHIRQQAETGEYWVHQTACFERREDADCLNSLYEKMRTGKWYPAVRVLGEGLESAGWEVVFSCPAPVLHLKSGELGARYGLDAADLKRIRREMGAEHGAENPVFQAAGDGFQAELHYRIWICRAAP
ncbi:MAG TPA: class I SAM-dependent methyltransferase [Kiritimatiellia bacterium]|nr:class I SAM-dependent methyltransferase [Kiritimatiellia bacterium]